MPRKKPCIICRRRFLPNPHVGARQKTCGAKACQQERHRRADRAWHAANPDYDRGRARKGRQAEEGAGQATRPAAVPAAASSPSEVRLTAQDAVSPQVRMMIEEIVQNRVRRAQDELGAQLAKITTEFREKRVLSHQDESAFGGPAP